MKEINGSFKEQVNIYFKSVYFSYFFHHIYKFIYWLRLRLIDSLALTG